MLVARYASGVIWIRGHPGERRISYLGCASNDYFCVIPTVCHGHPVQSFSVPPLSSKLGRGGRVGFLRNPHSLPRASCANPFTHVLAQASLDSSVRKSLLRREGDSNPRNPFGVYTLSRRASSTTRASLLRGSDLSSTTLLGTIHLTTRKGTKNI